MSADIYTKVLKRLLDKGLLQLDELAERGVVEEAAIDRMMEEILAEERQQPSSGQEEMIAISSEAASDVFGRYQDLELLGEGGMAKVYKAYDPELKRSVALKFLRIEDARLKERLLREARTQAGIDHPNICKVYEVGELRGRPYIAMQHIGGIMLKESAGQLGLEQKVVLIKQVAEALQEAHRLGLIHRDIKPSNIMVEANESGQWNPYLVDFGLARQIAEPGETLTDFIVGTPSYMSPEQAAGRVHSLDRRSDIYSLGVTFYELLCCQLPYKQNDAPMVQSVITEEAISLRKRNSSIPSDLETIVMKCLEKEPERRYESARALIDDLQRYLNGEPIQARPAKLSYRLLKKAKKNKVAVAIFGAAVLITLLLTGMLLWTEWRSRQETRYANEFSQEARYIESMMRSVYMAPLHDIRPELAKAKTRLGQLEIRVRQAGRLAKGPGHYALGQSYLVLKEYEKAYEHLDNSWRVGFRQPSTAYALGMVMGHLYRTALKEAELIRNKDQREARKRQLEKMYRDPAVAFLKMSSGNVESPLYIEGLIALYEKRFDEALRKALSVYSLSSWLYEAKKLEGDVYSAMAAVARENGDNNSITRFHEAAGTAYRAAAQIARSDLDIYLANCELWIDIIPVQGHQGKSPSDSLKEAHSLCDQAISINPELGAGFQNKSLAELRFADYLMYNTGEDPHPALTRATEMAHESIRRNPKDAKAYRTLGLIFNTIGHYEWNHGQDPGKAFGNSIEQIQKAIAIDPGFANAYVVLGTSYGILGAYEFRHGADPRPYLQKSIDQYRKALQLYEKDSSAYNNMGISYKYIGEYNLVHGEDAIKPLELALQQFHKAIQINPSYAHAYNNMGNTSSIIAEYEQSNGKDPRRTLERAIQEYQYASKINPSYRSAYLNAGICYIRMALYEYERGQDSRTTIQQSIEQYRKALEIDSGDASIYQSLGDAYYRIAELDIVQGKNPSEASEEAIQLSRKAIEINRNEAFPHSTLASVLNLLAEYALMRREDPLPYLNKARIAIQESIRIDPAFYDYYRIHGDAEILAGRSAMNQNRPAANYFEKARALLQRSIELNDRQITTYKSLVQCYRWRAEWQQKQKTRAKEMIEAGLQTVAKALSINSQHAEMIALRGVLHLLQGREEPDLSARTGAFRTAREDLERALKMNPMLELKYEPILKQALVLSKHKAT